MSPRARALVVSLPLAAGCGPGSFGATSTDLGVIPQSPAIQGRDGGQSGRVWGHSVWAFGDTVLNVPDVDGQTWHHNSYSITDDASAADGLDGFTEPLDAAGAPRYLLAPTADEAAFNAAHAGDPCQTAPCGARWAVWPARPLWDATDGRAIIFYSLVYAEPGDFNVHAVGASVALWNAFDQPPERPVIAPGADHPTLLFGQDEPSWGEGAVIDGGMLYALSCDHAADGLAPPCYLAEVDPAQVLDRSAWRYWDGDSWSADMTARARVFTGGSSMVSVARSAHLGRWAAIYAAPLSNDVVIRTAPAITGPWSDAQLLFTADKDPAGAYDATWHTEYDDGANVYITYSRPSGMGPFGADFVLEQVALP